MAFIIDTLVSLAASQSIRLGPIPFIISHMRLSTTERFPKFHLSFPYPFCSPERLQVSESEFNRVARVKRTDNGTGTAGREETQIHLPIHAAGSAAAFPFRRHPRPLSDSEANPYPYSECTSMKLALVKRSNAEALTVTEASSELAPLTSLTRSLS